MASFSDVGLTDIAKWSKSEQESASARHPQDQGSLNRFIQAWLCSKTRFMFCEIFGIHHLALDHCHIYSFIWILKSDILLNLWICFYKHFIHTVYICH